MTFQRVATVCAVSCLLAAPAWAGRIAVSSADCGTPPLLGLSFDVTGTSADSCGAAFDIGTGDPPPVTPLYGQPITAIGFLLTPIDTVVETLTAPSPEDQSALSFLFADDPAAGLYTLLGTEDDQLIWACPEVGPCLPDVRVFALEFTHPTRITVISVNGISLDQVVPEPATLTLLGTGLGLTAFLVRRRRRS